MKSSTSGTGKLQLGAWFSDQTHTCGDNMPIQGHTTFEEWYVRSEICKCACCVISLPIIMKVQLLGYSEMYIISVSNIN